MVTIIIVSIIILIVLFICFYFLIKSAENIHKEIDEIQKIAKSATTKQELETAWERLKIISPRCWHQAFSIRVVEVKTFIQTKYQYCK